MPSYNKVILIGNLTRDPEIRYTPKGTAVIDIGLAVNEVRGSGDDKTEETTFVDITLWGQTAEVAAKYLSKGSAVCVDGRLRLDTWEDKESGKKRSKLKVVGNQVQFLSSPKTGGSDNRLTRPSNDKAPQNPDPEDIEDDDLPF